MNTQNAFGFALVGTLMALGPWLMPQGFSPTGFGGDGMSTRALWLAVVGTSQILIGTAYLLHIWVARWADRVATVSFPMLDRSPLHSPLRRTSTAA